MYKNINVAGKMRASMHA